MSVVFLLDVSGSMASPASAGQRRIDALQGVLDVVLPGAPGARLICFGSEVEVLEPGRRLPEPSGGTALHLALRHLATGPRMARIIIISDGIADDPQAALTAARALAPVVIDAFHVGPERDAAALGFLRALTLAGGTGRGIALRHDLAKPKQLADQITLRLSGPAR